MEITNETARHGGQIAVLTDNKKVICRVYLSADSASLRFVLSELADEKQIKIDVKHYIVDFKRQL